MTRKTSAAHWPTEPLFRRKSGTCPKLGARSSGTLGYEIATSTDDSVFLRLCSNDSGGYFSAEWLALSPLQTLLEKQGAQTFPARTLQTLFTGRSANNASFLAAVLIAEGLLTRSEEKNGALQVLEHPDYPIAIQALPLGEEILPPQTTTETDTPTPSIGIPNLPAWPIENSGETLSEHPHGLGAEEADPMFQKRTSRKKSRRGQE